MLKNNMILRFTFMMLLSTFLLFMLSFMFMKKNLSYCFELNMINISSITFPILFIMDKVSMSFGFVVTFISMCVFMFAVKYMQEDLFYNRFILILLSFVLSMCFLIFSGSILMILLGWDGLGISSFALIIYYQHKEAFNAGFLTLIINRLGDVLIVSSIFFFLLTGNMTVYPLFQVNNYLIMILVLASLTKSAQYPFSSWLPAAMAAPTPVSALVHSSTLVTAGVYLIIRLSMNIPLNMNMSSLLCFCGSVTCLLGGMAAIMEMDLKKMIALSTLSQLGVMMFSLSLNYPFMALFHLYTHAMFKALLFLVAGVILLMSFGTQDLRLLGGVLLKSPMLMVFQNVSSLCLVGAPFISAFYSKHAILELMIQSNLNLSSMVIMFIATMCTSIYVIRSLKVLCWGKLMINIHSYFVQINLMFPLFLLMMMGIISGKMFLIVNESVIMSLYLPSYWGNIINIITVIGMFIGMMMNFTMKSKFLSYMFYLTPLWNKMPKVTSIIFKNMVSLDYGWLELKYYLYPNMYNLINLSNNMFMWPKMGSMNMLRALILMLYLLIICMIYY